MQKHPSIEKICIMGANNSGKSAIVIQFVSHHFVEEYDSNIEDSFRKRMVVDNEPLLFDILDTAGSEEFDCLNEQYIRNYNCFMLVYSITDESTFEKIEKIHKRILLVKDQDNVPMVLVGNKCDLENDRKVPPSKGQELACKLGSIPFFETSAKDRTNIEEAFLSVARISRQSIAETRLIAK